MTRLGTRLSVSILPMYVLSTSHIRANSNCDKFRSCLIAFSFCANKILTSLDIVTNVCKYVTIVDRQLALFKGDFMNIFIQNLEHQIIDLKDRASIIVGMVQNAIEFSNVPLYEESIYVTPLEKRKIRKINAKLKEMHGKFREIKDEIYKL